MEEKCPKFWKIKKKEIDPLTKISKIALCSLNFFIQKDSKRHLIMTRNMLLEVHPDGLIMLSGNNRKIVN